MLYVKNRAIIALLFTRKYNNVKSSFWFGIMYLILPRNNQKSVSIFAAKIQIGFIVKFGQN